MDWLPRWSGGLTEVLARAMRVVAVPSEHGQNGLKDAMS